MSRTEECFAIDSIHAIAFTRVTPLLLVACAPAPQESRSASESEQAEALRCAADRALEGRFDVLGLQGLPFGRPVDWHLEPTSGRRSPLVHWKRLDSLATSTTSDKKIVWELNRHQHLLTLGRAHLQFGDEQYARALTDDIAAWLRHNPPGVGINWVSSLEIALRCITWLWAIAMVRTGAQWPLLPSLEVARSLCLQGRHIEHYLSTYFSPNTHLTGEALGLYYLGTCLPELNCAERWRDLGRSILLKQLEVQVRPDGVYFEQSTWYQRYTADFYMHFIVLAARADDPIPSHVRERLATLLDYLMWITRPDGTSPYIGDDDGGKLVKLESCAPNDWRAVLSNGAVMFGRGDYKHVAGKCAEETRWLFGPSAKETFDGIPGKPPDSNSRAFVDGGFYVMRSGWVPDSNYLLIDCGPHGVMNCGHAHADALAIEVAALGTTILIDPGTFTYTGSVEFRDLFRSTAMHNSLTVDGLSSSVPAGPFKWTHVAHCSTLCWHDHPGFTYFEGCHDGYKRLSTPAIHTRSLLFVNREYWFMLDQVDIDGDHEHAVHFHMAPQVCAALHHQARRLEAYTPSASLDVAYPERQGVWSVADGWVSPCYGAKVRAPHGTYSVRTTGPAALLSVLFPRRPGELPPQIQNMNPEGGKGLVLATSQFRDLLLWSANTVASEGLHVVDFEWVWIRHSSRNHLLERAVLLHGTCILSDDIEVQTEHPVEFVVISVSNKALSIDVSPPMGIRIRPPVNIDRVLVNGRMHTGRAGDAVSVMRQDIQRLATPCDRIDWCRHVRH